MFGEFWFLTTATEGCNERCGDTRCMLPRGIEKMLASFTLGEARSVSEALFAHKEVVPNRDALTEQWFIYPNSNLPHAWV